MPAGPLSRLGHAAREPAAAARRRHRTPARAGLRSRAGCLRDLGLLPRLRRRLTQRGDVGVRRISLRAELLPPAVSRSRPRWAAERRSLSWPARSLSPSLATAGFPGRVSAIFRWQGPAPLPAPAVA